MATHRLLHLPRLLLCASAPLREILPVARGFVALVSALAVCSATTADDDCPGTRGALGNGSADSGIITVRAEDIPDKVQIIGNLGKPMGTLLTIRGTWVSPERLVKDPNPRFHIDVVNGKRPAKPVALYSWQVGPVLKPFKGRKGNSGDAWDWTAFGGSDVPPKSAAGETWEMIGVETAGFEDYSAVWEEITGRPGSLIGMPTGWSRFHTRFEFVRVRVVKQE